MKVLFDSQIFDSQKYGGISRYFSELFKNFNNREDIKYKLPIRNSENEYLKNIKPFSDMAITSRIFSSLKGRSFLYKIFDLFDKKSNKNLLKRELKKQDFDIFHPTYYSTYFLKYLKNKPFVLTVYDMIHEKYPQYFLLDFNKTILNKKELIKKANKIIAISENTKKDIIDLYGIPEDKIQVIYLGNSMIKTQNKSINIPEIPEKYILFVGARDGYKNFTFFIKSISSILRNDRRMNVVVAGGYSGKNIFSKKENILFKELDIDKQIIHYSINDEVLAYLYQNAMCFVFPTLYEGFGIPVLEAFACDCPVIVSNTSSLPEVGGNAVEYIDPTNSLSILNSIEKVIQNKELRKEMIKKGQDQLRKFSWEKTAKETLSLYSDIL